MSRARSAMHVFTDTDRCAEKLFHAWTRLQKKSADMIPEKDFYCAGIDRVRRLYRHDAQDTGKPGGTIVIITGSNSSITQSKLTVSIVLTVEILFPVFIVNRLAYKPMFGKRQDANPWQHY
jgi:hypothetical protein